MKKKDSVNILIISTYDTEGGAAIACHNLMEMLREMGYNAILLVRYKSGNDNSVYEVSHIVQRKSILMRALCKLKKRKEYRELSEDSDVEYKFFCDDIETSSNCSLEEVVNSVPFVPDIIFVGHTFGFVDTNILVGLYKMWKSRIFMLSVDVNAYTAGCHVHWDCKGYTKWCNNCPAILVEERRKEVANLFLKKKINVLNGNIGIVYGNGWQKSEIDNSDIFKNQTKLFLSQATDTRLYDIKNRDVAKKLFGFSGDSKVIMCGCSNLDDKRKGMSFVIDAMRVMWEELTSNEKKSLHLMIVGKNINASKKYLKSSPPYDVKFVPYITDFRLLSLAYQASDVYLSPSLEDAGPMMVADAMACGTPVVGFKTGILADENMFKIGSNGYAVELRDVEGLADGILKILRLSDDERSKIVNECRQNVLDNLSKTATMRLFDEYVKSM